MQRVQLSRYCIVSGKEGERSRRAPLRHSPVAHNVPQPVLRRQLQADAVATRELQRRARAVEVIDRTHGVDDVLPVWPQKGVSFVSQILCSFLERMPEDSRWKVVARGEASLARRAAA